MKSSKKLIVGGLIGMLGIVGATTATSGVAWFTTTRTSAVSIDNFIATAAEGNLTITNGTTISEAGLTQTITSNNSAIAATAKLTDVSSCDGVNFYKVTTVNAVSTTKSETSAVNSINNTLYNYYVWDITVANSSPTAPMDVYISHAGDIFSDVVTETPTNISPEQWYRLCIFDTTWAAANCVFSYGQEDTAAAKDKGINSTSDTTGAGTFTRATTCTEINSDPSTATVSSTNQLLIKNLSNASPKTLIFVVWCEGLLTPANDVDLEVNGAFNLVGFNHAA